MVVKALETITLARVDDGTPGSKDVPMTYVQATQPTGSIVKDSIWWVGDSMKTATALKRWNGSAWVPDTIAQAILNIKELNAITINSSTFNGSTFNSTFEKVQPDGTTFTVHGNSTLENGGLSTIAYRDTDNSLYTETHVSPIEIGSTVYDGGVAFDTISLREGQLMLSGMYNDGFGTDPYRKTGLLTPAALLSLQNNGLTLWTGAMYMSSADTITPSVPIAECEHGWLIVWNRYGSGGGPVDKTGGYWVTPVWKAEVAKNDGGAMTFVMYTSNMTQVQKYVYIGRNQMRGNDISKTGNNVQYVATTVYGF